MWGLRPNARQIRETADCDIPVAAAIDRVDQCVSAPGLSSSVAVTTRSTCSSVIVRGQPGRGSSLRPSSRSDRNRDRHFDTVFREVPACSATRAIVAPPAHSSTIRARNANACEVLRRRTHPVSTDRSSSDNTTGSSFGLGIPTAYRLTKNF